MYLHELLAGSEVYVEPLKLPEKVAATLLDVYFFISKARIKIEMCKLNNHETAKCLNSSLS